MEKVRNFVVADIHVAFDLKNLLSVQEATIRIRCESPCFGFVSVNKSHLPFQYGQKSVE